MPKAAGLIPGLDELEVEVVAGVSSLKSRFNLGVALAFPCAILAPGAKRGASSGSTSSPVISSRSGESILHLIWLHRWSSHFPALHRHSQNDFGSKQIQLGLLVKQGKTRQIQLAAVTCIQKRYNCCRNTNVETGSTEQLTEMQSRF